MVIPIQMCKRCGNFMEIKREGGEIILECEHCKKEKQRKEEV